MALSNISFDELSERDLLDQVHAGVPEGVLVDYKRDLYGRTDSEVREFLKDVSSFANTAGGHLIIGMDESSGTPTALAPLTGFDPDQELQRLENMARDGIERAYEAHQLLRPLASMGMTPRINFDGFANLHHGSDGRCWSYTQVFRNGAIEAVKVRVAMQLDGKLLIPTLDFDKHIFDVLPGYLTALQRLDVPAPVVLMLTLQGVRGARLGVAPQPLDEPAPIDRAVLELPEVVIERYGIDLDYQRASRPAFDALWNTGGFFRSSHFDTDGRWIGPPPRRY